MINANEAQKIICSSVQALGLITRSLEKSLGYVLAEDIISQEDIPPFDNSAMDGYAIRSCDVQNAPGTLHIIGEIAAGAIASKELQQNETMSIMTGAKIPAGCDAVIQQEWTTRADDEHITILRSIERGHNIRLAGADIKRGETVLQAGRQLRPQEIGVLASLGKHYVEVYRRPAVAILATGNEIVDIAKPLSDGKIRNSNAYTLAALVEDCGCESRMLGIAKDDRADFIEHIINGLTADMLITTGGISVGKYDLVMEALKGVSVEIKFWKVNIKPGMPLMFGMYGAKPVFALPGNPVSTMVTFLQFVKPALLKMAGEKVIDEGFKIRAKIEHDLKKTDGKRHFIRGILEHKNGAVHVRSTGSQISNILSSLSNANCLIIVPEEIEYVCAGNEVEVQLL